MSDCWSRASVDTSKEETLLSISIGNTGVDALISAANDINSSNIATPKDPNVTEIALGFHFMVVAKTQFRNNFLHSGH